MHFGCLCWPNLHPFNRHKLDLWSKPCVFMGYSPNHKGYNCLHLSMGCVYLSMDVTFRESIFPFALSPLPSVIDTTQKPHHFTLPQYMPMPTPISPCEPPAQIEVPSSISAPMAPSSNPSSISYIPPSLPGPHNSLSGPRSSFSSTQSMLLLSQSCNTSSCPSMSTHPMQIHSKTKSIDLSSVPTIQFLGLNPGLLSLSQHFPLHSYLRNPVPLPRHLSTPNGERL